MSDTAIRVATRRSVLARTQAQHVADALTTISGRPAELIFVTTRGDIDRAPLSSFDGVGVFVAAVRDAVLTGEADIAVHSLKDLPTQGHPGLLLAAVPRRADPRDALCARDGLTLATLPPNAKVGTGSPRRAAQLRAHRPDLDVVDIRGNVDTRLQLIAAGDVDAVVLALAGLDRLGRSDAATQVLDPETMLPAPGQGALAVETRSDLASADPALYAALVELDDPDTRVAVVAERSLLAALEAGCSAPVGAYAVLHSGQEATVHLTGAVVDVDGSREVRQSVTGARDAAVELGQGLARQLLALGAPGLLGERVP